MIIIKKEISIIIIFLTFLIISVLCENISAQDNFKKHRDLPAWEEPYGMISSKLSLGVGEIDRGGWADAIQEIILVVGALVCAGLLLFSMPEGPGQFFEIAIENNKFSLGSFKFELTTSTFWLVLIYGLSINMQNYGIDQNFIQRNMIASSEKEAKKSAMYGGLLYVPVSLLFLFG